jgi:hypothetical protein
MIINGMSGQSQKRLFLSLLGGSLFALFLLIAGIWYLVFNPVQSALYRVLLMVIVVAVAGGALLIAFGITGIVLTLVAAKSFPFLQFPIQLAVRTFFPAALTLGRLLHINVDRIRNSFIEVNNQLVRTRCIKVKPEEILLLVPHCLQWTKCPHKITVDINNCHRCGNCYIDELLSLRDKYHVHIGVATGGTLARKYVEEYRPHAIVAIACERDLTSGIQDACFLPVLGVTNERPYGPCRDTCISISRVEEAILHFLPPP